MGRYNNGNTCRCLGETAVTAGVAPGQKTFEKMVFPVQKIRFLKKGQVVL
jgi:hypothetical protein